MEDTALDNLRKELEKKLSQYLAGRVSSEKIPDVVKSFMKLHEENLKTFSLDDMENIATYYLKKNNLITESEDQQNA